MQVKTDLTHTEMQAIFARRVQETLGMTVEQYRHAREAGTLPRTPATIALQVFSGEAGTGQRHGSASSPLAQG